MIKNIIGYVIGFFIFVVFIPAIMFPETFIINPAIWQICCFSILSFLGISLSLYSIIYMKYVGKGNPMDAFNHEIAPQYSS